VERTQITDPATKPGEDGRLILSSPLLRPPDVTGAGFTNFSGVALTGGKYIVSGTLGFDGANIVTNAASITLAGAASEIINDLTSANALTSFVAKHKDGLVLPPLGSVP
jgi:hypothetical protein